MTETISYIHQSLKDLYPAGEITSFTRQIMEYVCGLQPHQFLLCKGKELSDTEKEDIKQIVIKLKQSEPIQYIIGQTTFYDLPFLVNPSVLIPRPETEELVELIIKTYSDSKIRILDIGTGSGCIAVSLAKFLPSSEVTALDISSEALNVARENAKRNNVSVSLIRTDILNTDQSIKDISGNFDIIVSNPPYVKESEKLEMNPNVLNYEPSQALFVPDDDPLIFYRAITDFGRKKLTTNGSLFFEINAQCGNEMVSLLKEYNYKEVELIRDISEKDRIIKGNI